MAEIFDQSILHGTLLLRSSAPWRFRDFEYVEGTAKGPEIIEHWDLYLPVTIPRSPLDTYHTVRDHEVGRLDMLSYTYYGSTRLMQLLAIANNLIVINDEMFAGMVLRIPDATAFEIALNSARVRKSRLTRGVNSPLRSTGT